jgi:hypothetical protein
MMRPKSFDRSSGTKDWREWDGFFVRMIKEIAKPQYADFDYTLSVPSNTLSYGRLYRQVLLQRRSIHF